MRSKKTDKFIVVPSNLIHEENEHNNIDYREKVIAACRLYKFMTLRRRDGEDYPKPFLSRNIIYQSKANKITADKATGIRDPPLLFKVNRNKKKDMRDNHIKRRNLEDNIRKIALGANIRKINNITMTEEKRALRDYCDLDAYYSGVERACRNLHIKPQQEIVVKKGYIVGQNAEGTREKYSDFISISAFSFQGEQKRCYCHFKFYLNYIFHDGRQVTEEIKNGEFRGFFPIANQYQIDLPSPKKMRIATKEAKILIKIRTALVQDLSEPIGEIPSFSQMEMPGFYRAEYFGSRTIWTNRLPLEYEYCDFAISVVHVKNLRPGFIYEERQYDIYSRDLMCFENPAIIGKVVRSQAEALSLHVPTTPLYSNLRIRKCTKNCGTKCNCGYATGIISGQCAAAFNSDFLTNEERMKKYYLSHDPNYQNDLQYIEELLDRSRAIENESSSDDEYDILKAEGVILAKRSRSSIENADKINRALKTKQALLKLAQDKLEGNVPSSKPPKAFRRARTNQKSNKALKDGSGVLKSTKAKKFANASKKTKGAAKAKCSKKGGASNVNKKAKVLKATKKAATQPVGVQTKTGLTPVATLRRSSRFQENPSPAVDKKKKLTKKAKPKTKARKAIIKADDIKKETEEDEVDSLEKAVLAYTAPKRRRSFFNIYQFIGKYPPENGKYVNHFRFLQNVYRKSFLTSADVHDRMQNIFINTPEVYLFYRFVGRDSSEFPGTRIYSPILKYDHRSCHTEHLYSDDDPSSFIKLRPAIPSQCIICDRSFHTIFSLLMHYNLNYPRLQFNYAIAKTEKTSKSMITQIDVSLNPYFHEGIDKRSISIGNDATQDVPFFVLTPWHTRTIRNNMRMDLTLFVDGISSTDMLIV